MLLNSTGDNNVWNMYIEYIQIYIYIYVYIRIYIYIYIWVYSTKQQLMVQSGKWMGMSSLIPDSSKIIDKLALIAHNIVHKSLEKTTIIHKLRKEDLDPCGFQLYCPKFDMLRSNNGVKFGNILKGKEKERDLFQKERVCGFISSKEKTTVSVKIDFLKNPVIFSGGLYQSKKTQITIAAAPIENQHHNENSTISNQTWGFSSQPC